MLAAVVGRMPEASRHRLMAALTDFNTAAAAVDGSAAAAGTGPARDEAEHVDGDLAHWLS
jgi:hypothetical protein